MAASDVAGFLHADPAFANRLRRRTERGGVLHAHCGEDGDPQLVRREHVGRVALAAQARLYHRHIHLPVPGNLDALRKQPAAQERSSKGTVIALRTCLQSLLP